MIRLPFRHRLGRDGDVHSGQRSNVGISCSYLRRRWCWGRVEWCASTGRRQAEVPRPNRRCGRDIRADHVTITHRRQRKTGVYSGLMRCCGRYTITSAFSRMSLTARSVCVQVVGQFVSCHAFDLADARSLRMYARCHSKGNLSCVKAVPSFLCDTNVVATSHIHRPVRGRLVLLSSESLPHDISRIP
jgi:hypothetical protein